MIRRLILLAAAILALAFTVGCGYSTATWNTKSGKMYVAKNGLFGLVRGVYECTPAGESFNCQQLPDSP